MDTSPQYVQMAKQAKEIQTQAPGELGYWRLDEDELSIQSNGDWYYGTTWLPRQDQLQEMGSTGRDLDHYLEDFDMFIRRSWDYYKGVTPIGYFASLEQLWLAYVMWARYQQRWNGEGWVAEEEDVWGPKSIEGSNQIITDRLRERLNPSILKALQQDWEEADKLIVYGPITPTRVNEEGIITSKTEKEGHEPPQVLHCRLKDIARLTLNAIRYKSDPR